MLAPNVGTSRRTSSTGTAIAVLKRILVAALVVALSYVALPAAQAAKPAQPGTTSTYPSSMASTGDSITRAFNACGGYVDCSTASWSTGTDTAVPSHYQRILAKNSAIRGKNYNDSKSGAKMTSLGAQMSTAVTQKVQYVTVEMGSNDICTSTESEMTSISTYRSQLDTALATLKNGLPNTKVLIASIPSVYRLWEIGYTTGDALTAWNSFGICQSMLKDPTSFAQADVDRRDRVRQRNIDFNTQLAEACTLYGPNCKFDGNAVFNYPFVLGQVSGWDYFHPNKAGQKVLADVTWANGFTF